MNSIEYGYVDDIKQFLSDYIDKKFKESATGICYAYDKVFIFEIKDGEIILPESIKLNNNIHELRVFDLDSELYIYRVNDKLKYRYRKDDGTNKDYKDIEMYLWGSIKNSGEIVEENRGIRIKLPESLALNFEKAKKVRLKTQNYYQFDEDGKIFICDSRFVKFIGG